MPQKRRSKRVHKLNKGNNFVDFVMQVEGMLYLLEKDTNEITKDTPREKLRDMRFKIMKLCNPDRQGITDIQRLKAEEIRDEFHRKLSKFGIPRWWQRSGASAFDGRKR